MKTLNQMLRELSRAEVAEFAVVSDRLPCVKIGEAYEPVDDIARSTEAILQILVTAGGSRHVETLDVKPAQWTTRVEGVGIVSIVAMMRRGRIQARFTVLGRQAEPSSQRHASGTPDGAGPVHLPQGRSSRPASRRSARSKPAMKLASPPPSNSTPPAAIVPSPDRRAALESALDRLLFDACESGASDLHLVAGRPMLLRLAGELLPRGSAIDDASIERMILPAVPERLRALFSEHGSCDFALESVALRRRFRVNVARQRSGFKACFRCISADVPTLASLGLPADIARAAHHHQGLVLVTGPTGHGKTSTLAALVDVINSTTTHHVVTVEDPVEYVHPRKKAMISQREVGSHTRSFQNALKASLREDPDVIVVGELRDTDTVRMALAASETGHLVLGTMNTPSAAKTIDRLVDLFPSADQQQVRMTLAGGLHLVVGQRLLPAADGSGMVGAVELLPGSIALWSLIRDGKTFQIPSLQQRGKGIGIVRLDDSLADLLRSGRVTRAAALAVAENAEELEAVISGKRQPTGGVGVVPPPRAEGPSLLDKAGQLFGRRGS